MKQYKSVEVTNLNNGCVELDEDQARRRIHNLKEVGKGIFEIVNPIQFKVGEKFGYDGEVNARLAQSLIKKEVEEEKNTVKKTTKKTTKKK